MIDYVNYFLRYFIYFLFVFLFIFLPVFCRDLENLVFSTRSTLKKIRLE